MTALLENGYLWNSSGIAEYFFDLYSRPDFQAQYERSGSVSSATRADFSRLWPRLTGCMFILPMPILPWPSSAAV